jgi:hypothetical protein
METAKRAVEKMIRNLPDDCSLEDIWYQVYLLERKHNGLEDNNAPQAEVIAMLRAKFQNFSYR